MTILTRRNMIVGAAAAAASPTLLHAAPPAASTDWTSAGFLDARTFGLDPAAADNAPALRRALAAASAAGRTLVIPPGRYLLDSFDPAGEQAFCVRFSDPALNLDVACMGEFALGPAASATTRIGAMIRIECRGGTDRSRFRWVGGRFDMTAARRSTRGLGALSLGPKIWSAIVRDTVFDGGTGDPGQPGNAVGGGGGDQYLFTKETEFLLVEGCEFRGAADCGIYINADENPARSGQRAVIQASKFTRCSTAIAIKRRFEQLTVTGCFIEDGSTGILFGSTGRDPTNNGRRANITGNVIRRMMGNPIDIRDSDFVSVTGNTILDYRRLLGDPDTSRAVRTGNIGGAVKLTGASHCEVVGNSLGFDAWTAPNEGGSEAVGVAILSYDRIAPPLPSTGNVIASNVIVRARRTVWVAQDCPGNTIGPNRAIAVPEPPVYRAANLEIYDEGRFAPTIDGATGTGASGTWRRDGTAVTVTISIPLRGRGSPQAIGNLPFPPAADPATTLLLARYDNTPAQAVLGSDGVLRPDRGSGATLVISGSYRAA